MLTRLLLLLTSLIFAQYHPQEWGSITSLLTPTGIQITTDGTVYTSTAGGLLKFNPVTEKFTFIKMEEGLVYLDLSTIEIDSRGRLWLGGAYPRGYIQVYDPEKGLVRKITHLDITQINKIQIGVDIAFAIYEGATSSEIGILEFQLDSDGLPDYQDFYTNFTDETITEIRDLDIFQDSLYVTTDQGIFSSNYKEDNLKSAAKWISVFSSNTAEQFLPGIEPITITDSTILKREDVIWEEYYDYSADLPYQCEKKYDNEYVDCTDDLFCYEYPDPTYEKPNNTVNLGYCGPKVIQAVQDEGLVKLLFDKWYYEIAKDELIFSYQISVGNQGMEKNIIGGKMKTEFTSFSFTENGNLFFGLYDYGILSISFENDISPIIFAPNTSFRNEFQAITITSDGKMAATSQLGTIFHNKGKYKNFIPVHFHSYYPEGSDNVDFYTATLQYKASEHFPISILEKDNGKLIFSNSGVFPSWGTAVIELDPVSHGLTTFGDNNDIIDGIWGIYKNTLSMYMVVNQIEKDKIGNILVTNPFCEKNGNMIAIQAKDDGTWSHIHVPDEISYRPQTIAFDKSNRAWVGFAYESLGDTLYSSGGIKVLKYSGINFADEDDSTWLTIANPEVLPGGSRDASVWSIVFDKMDFLWILNEKGIQGYEVSGINEITLDPIQKYVDEYDKIVQIDFLTHLSYSKGNRIRVDSQNNKWIITHQGVWVIEESMAFWPSEEGLHPDNSGLLSDIVYDVAFDNDKGLAYLATDKGISILQIPFADNPSKKQSMYLSPNPLILPDDERLIIKNVAAGSIIKIMTITGSVVKEIRLSPNQSQTTWDGTNFQGEQVGAAVYLIAAHHPSERNKVSKVAVIRK